MSEFPPGWREAEPVFKRDRWVCRYRGLDGRKSFAAWQSLSWDHLLRQGHPKRDAIEFIVTACAPCNSMLGGYLKQAEQAGEKFEPPDAASLVEARRRFLQYRLAKRREYCRTHVSLRGAS